MKKYLVTAALASMALLTVLPVSAANTVSLKGKNEVLGAAAWMKGSGGGVSADGTLVGVNYGKFITDNVELELGLIYGKVSGNTSGSSSGNLSATILAPSVVYNFVPKQPAAAIPYVGAGLAYAQLAGSLGSATSTKLQYFAGGKFYIGGNADVANKFIFLEYRHADAKFKSTSIKIDAVWTGIAVTF